MKKEFGYMRVAAAVPILEAANPMFNVNEMISLIEKSVSDNVQVIVFPELSITGSTCGDLFYQSTLIKEAEKALSFLVHETRNLNILIAVGAPIMAGSRLFNCAVIIKSGDILGVVPKTYLSEDKRWFSSSKEKTNNYIFNLCGQDVTFSEYTLFKDTSSQLCMGVEIGDDLSFCMPPGIEHSLNGANAILNLSSAPLLAGNSEHTVNSIMFQSSKLNTAYVYSSAGQWESTTDYVSSGQTIIAECGKILHKNMLPSKSCYIFSDIDLEKIQNERIKLGTCTGQWCMKDYYINNFELGNLENCTLKRTVDKTPFVPFDSEKRNLRCEEIIAIQATGLSQRLSKIGSNKVVIGVSGGLDSTLALISVTEAFKALNLPFENIIAITMPGFGTTSRTYTNALAIMDEFGVTTREISIKEACLQHFKDIGHDAEIHDVTYENAQARERTQILMDYANKEKALVVGTGDLSELALGWCTYNGDHMSMYSVNAGIPKTLVKYLVKWYAEKNTAGKLNKALHDVYDTPVSPELLPPDKEGNIAQLTEKAVGSYDLNDFFLYNAIKNCFGPDKIYYLAKIAFKNEYEDKIILETLKNFYKRFFTQQFKRSCMPDGVKVGTVSLSPRGDWKMPSDASYELWMKKLNELEI